MSLNRKIIDRLQITLRRQREALKLTEDHILALEELERQSTPKTGKDKP